MTVWRNFSFIYPKESYANERWRGICRLFEPVSKGYELYLTYLHKRDHVTLYIQSQTANYLHSCPFVFRDKILKHINTD